MKLRPEIEPQLGKAEQNYQQILDIINEYEKYVDDNGDVDDDVEYRQIVIEIQYIVDKDVSAYSLYETCEVEGSEVLAFRISLPNATKVENLTKDEVFELVRRLKIFNIPKDDSFAETFSPYLDDYYHQFLKLNCGKKYKYSYFISQKDGSELSIDETVSRLISAS